MDCWQDIPETRPSFSTIECRISCFLKVSENPLKTNSDCPLQERNSTDILEVNGRNHENYVEMSESELLPNAGIYSQMDNNNIAETNEDCSITCDEAHSDLSHQVKCNDFNELTQHSNLCETNSQTVLDFAPADHNPTPCNNQHLVGDANATFHETHL